MEAGRRRGGGGAEAGRRRGGGGAEVEGTVPIITPTPPTPWRQC